jgi:hypothetical protein
MHELMFFQTHKAPPTCGLNIAYRCGRMLCSQVYVVRTLYEWCFTQRLRSVQSTPVRACDGHSSRINFQILRGHNLPPAGIVTLDELRQLAGRARGWL